MLVNIFFKIFSQVFKIRVECPFKARPRGNFLRTPLGAGINFVWKLTLIQNFMFLFSAEQSAPKVIAKIENLGFKSWFSVCNVGSINGHC